MRGLAMNVFSYRRLACQVAVVAGFTLAVIALLVIYAPETFATMLATLHGESLAPSSALTDNSEAQILLLMLGLTLFFGGHVPMFRSMLTKARIRREIRNWLAS